MKLNIPDYVKKVTDTLNQNGFEAFVVGGAVRDALLGQMPDDWDVTTNADTTQIKNCFDRHFDTGIKHGTITVLMDRKPVEVMRIRYMQSVLQKMCTRKKQRLRISKLLT